MAFRAAPVSAALSFANVTRTAPGMGNLAKATVVALEEILAYVPSLALVAVTMHVPAVADVRTVPVLVQPVAVPLATKKLSAPVPEPPVMTSGKGRPYVAFTFEMTSAVWVCPTLIDDVSTTLKESHENRIHSWHLFVVRLRLERLTIDRGCVIAALKDAGVGTSVHWIPLHLHPYYKTMYGYRPEDFPTALRRSREIISLPIFPDMQEAEIAYVAQSLITVVRRHRR